MACTLTEGDSQLAKHRCHTATATAIECNGKLLASYMD